jgi:hypothetical protein
MEDLSIGSAILLHSEVASPLEDVELDQKITRYHIQSNIVALE